MGRLPRLPLAMFDRNRGRRALSRDQLAYCDLAAGRQQRLYYVVREHHALIVSRALSDALRQVSNFVGDNWARVPYSIRQGVKAGTEAKVLMVIFLFTRATLWAPLQRKSRRSSDGRQSVRDQGYVRDALDGTLPPIKWTPYVEILL